MYKSDIEYVTEVDFVEVLLCQWRPVIIEDNLMKAFQFRNNIPPPLTIPIIQMFFAQQYDRESSTPRACETWKEKMEERNVDQLIREKEPD
ncbi:hypothetical protein MAR_018588 [Mya arenaria]|uniref:Uncharacterized protein n=1 Tax=Mya arenaria TaxID=6604 RepID=A0ABY7EF34_MYAAR|nr:hypothetical protein MAR_018588 [Mya arenaria]